MDGFKVEIIDKERRKCTKEDGGEEKVGKDNGLRKKRKWKFCRGKGIRMSREAGTGRVYTRKRRKKR